MEKKSPTTTTNNINLINIELKEYLEGLSFTEGNSRVQGEYVLERAFVEK